MKTEKHASPAEHWLPATALITVITGIGFALRTWNLAERSIWFDEAFSWTLSSQFSPLEIIQRTAKDTHPPLYGLLLWAWMKGFGDSLMAIRMLSAVSGTLAIIVAYFSGVEAIRATQKCGSIAQARVDNSGRLLGILFAMLLACSPFQIHWSREVRMYAVLTLLFLVSVLMGLRALNKSSKSPWNWIAFSLASSLMLYTHNYAIFSYAAINCGLMVAAWEPHQTGKQLRGQRELLKVILAAAFSVVLYAPWIPVLLQQKTRVAENFWIAPCCLTQVAAAWDAAVFPEVKFEQWHKTRGLLSLITTAIILIVIQVRATVMDRLVLVLGCSITAGDSRLYHVDINHYKSVLDSYPLQRPVCSRTRSSKMAAINCSYGTYIPNCIEFPVPTI